jgi:hypothetical protein
MHLGLTSCFSGQEFNLTARIHEPMIRNYAHLFAIVLKPTDDTGDDLTQVFLRIQASSLLRRSCKFLWASCTFGLSQICKRRVHVQVQTGAAMGISSHHLTGAPGNPCNSRDYIRVLRLGLPLRRDHWTQAKGVMRRATPARVGGDFRELGSLRCRRRMGLFIEASAS